MRILAPAAFSLVVAACTTAPQQAPPTRVPPAPAQPQPHLRGGLIGLSVEELGARFGAPTFQVREGPGLKLQWAVPGCVLDAYLYPPPNNRGVARVTYVDARRPTGEPTDQAGCIAAVDAAG